MIIGTVGLLHCEKVQPCDYFLAWSRARPRCEKTLWFRFALAHAVDLNRIGVDGDLGGGRNNVDDDDEGGHISEGLTREFRSGVVYENPSGF